MNEADPQLLEALAQELRQPAPLDLELFANQTASKILSQPRPPVDSLRPWLEGPLHPALSTLLAAWGALCIWWAPDQAGSWGMVLIVLASLAKAVLHLEDLRRPRLAHLYYVLPVWASLSTGAIAAALTMVPIMFGLLEGIQPAHLSFLPVAVGLGLFVYLSSATAPLWQALRQRTQGDFSKLLQVQGVLAIFIVLSQGILLYPLMLTYPWLGWLLPLLLAGLVSFLLRRPVAEELLGQPLAPALRQAAMSLAVPIALGALLGPIAYGTLLPTRLHEQALYAQVTGQAAAPEAASWPKFAKQFVDDSPKGLQDPVQDFYVLNEPARKAQAESEIVEFEKRLPELKAALADTELRAPLYPEGERYGLGMRRLQVRLFAVCLENARQRKLDQAIESLRLLLRCHQVLRGPVFFPAQVARPDLCLRALDQILQARPGRLQLEQLAQEVQRAQPDRHELEVSVREGLRQMDGLYRRLGNGTQPPGAPGQLWLLLPRRYWESARVRAFDHYSVALLDARLLDRPTANMSLGDPFGMPRPMSQGQTNFQSALSQFELMKTLIALERYRLEHGGYPERLEQLVPGLLPQMPVDVPDARMWSKKPAPDYRRRGDSYELEVTTPDRKRKVLSPARGFSFWD